MRVNVAGKSISRSLNIICNLLSDNYYQAKSLRPPGGLVDGPKARMAHDHNSRVGGGGSI